MQFLKIILLINFYIFNKKIIQPTEENTKTFDLFLLIAGMNGEKELIWRVDEKYGYASINDLSKAIFNLSYNEKNYIFGNILKNVE